MSLDVLLEILRALESLATEVALVRLQRNVNTDVRSDVVTLDGGGAAVAPLARQIQVVGALAPNVTFANVILGDNQQTESERFRRSAGIDVRRKRPSSARRDGACNSDSALLT